MITVDSWLLDLADMGKEYAPVAHALGVMQRDVSRDLGHIVALNDNFVRGKIRQTARYGQLAAVNVRCLRCGAVASLKHWCWLASKSDQERRNYFLSLPIAARATAGKPLRHCEGELKAEQKIDVLEAQARGEL